MSLIKSDGSHTTTLYTTIGQYILKLNISVPYDPAVPLPGISPREMGTCIPQRHGQECSQQSYNSQKLGTIQMSITRRMYKQLQCTHTLVYYEQ